MRPLRQIHVLFETGAGEGVHEHPVVVQVELCHRKAGRRLPCTDNMHVGRAASCVLQAITERRREGRRCQRQRVCRGGHGLAHLDTAAQALRRPDTGGRIADPGRQGHPAERACRGRRHRPLPAHATVAGSTVVGHGCRVLRAPGHRVALSDVDAEWRALHRQLRHRRIEHAKGRHAREAAGLAQAIHGAQLELMQPERNVHHQIDAAARESLQQTAVVVQLEPRHRQVARRRAGTGYPHIRRGARGIFVDIIDGRRQRGDRRCRERDREGRARERTHPPEGVLGAHREGMGSPARQLDRGIDVARTGGRQQLGAFVHLDRPDGRTSGRVGVSLQCHRALGSAARVSGAILWRRHAQAGWRAARRGDRHGLAGRRAEPADKFLDHLPLLVVGSGQRARDLEIECRARPRGHRGHRQRDTLGAPYGIVLGILGAEQIGMRAARGPGGVTGILHGDRHVVDGASGH